VADTYRIRRGDDVWHRCRNCPDWPDWNYVEVVSLPRDALLCVTCRAKLDAETCH
jgi:hypothetical protein